MTTVRTSVSHPILVDYLSHEVAPFRGRIGMTFAPGKSQRGGLTGHWERDLAIDTRDLAEKYGTHLLLSLVEDHELRELKIEGLVGACETLGIRVLRLPIKDQGVPSLELAKTAVRAALGTAARGENVVIHCMGGLGRTGLIAACALVALGVDPERAMGAVRKAREDAIENARQEDFVRSFAKSGFRFASAEVVEPLDRLRVTAQELMTEHPPQWQNQNKRVVFEISSPSGSAHRGELEYSRWAPMSVPSRVDVRAASKRLRPVPGFFEYTATASPAVEWHVNFADASLFGYYSGGLFAQDEMQAVEHPALGALRRALDAKGMKALTEERGQPTPVLVMGVERRCRVATNPDRAAGRPEGLYGNAFAHASEDAIRRATERIEPPTRTNLICIAAPHGARDVYTSAQIERVLVTACTGFRAAVLESKRASTTGGDAAVVVHTGWWGCGAFGGNRVLMAILQVIAAEMAGVGQLVFHFGGPGEKGALKEAVGLLESDLAAAGEIATTALIERLAATGFAWGVGNGT